jgi:uncharacterized 2Fe-2S/4Fe-4S cluster protein (DUF4445 family)
MLQITFLPSEKTVAVPENTELLEAAREAGVEIDTPCGGKGSCGKCAVKLVSGEVDTDSRGKLTDAKVKEGFILTCKSCIKNTPATIEIPEQAIGIGGKFIDPEENIKLIDPVLFPEKKHLNPVTNKYCITIPPPQLEDGLSDIDRLDRVLKKEAGAKEIEYSLRFVQKLADTIRAENGKLTVTLAEIDNKYHVVEIEPGDTTNDNYGIAVDIGTTTVSVMLVSLTNGKILSSISDYNAQISCGLDIISRINFAQRPKGLDTLRKRIMNTVNRLIRHASDAHGIQTSTITGAAVSGNTTMIHLLLGLKPEYIRLEPYTPTVLDVPDIAADNIRLEINPHSPVYISPGVGSYVGGDITAGLLCTDFAINSDKFCLFIDIGTNGELVIGNNNVIMTCACSAGPAFEGGSIEYGMRAASGAVDRVEIDPGTGQATFQTIGNEKPLGICGSGLISLVAGLFSAGWIDSAGKLDRTRSSQYIKINGRRGQYVIVPEKESGTGRPITLSELDIENFLRSKAAIYSACSLLLKQLEIEFDDLEKIYIAGGFGRFLDIEKAVTIGLLPDVPREKFHYLGNSSVMGTYMTLVSKKHKKLQQDLTRKITYVELNTDPAYMDQYTGALFLPHTDISRFPSVKMKGK